MRFLIAITAMLVLATDRGGAAPSRPSPTAATVIELPPDRLHELSRVIDRLFELEAYQIDRYSSSARAELIAELVRLTTQEGSQTLAERIAKPEWQGFLGPMRLSELEAFERSMEELQARIQKKADELSKLVVDNQTREEAEVRLRDFAAAERAALSMDFDLAISEITMLYRDLRSYFVRPDTRQIIRTIPRNEEAATKIWTTLLDEAADWRTRWERRAAQLQELARLDHELVALLKIDPKTLQQLLKRLEPPIEIAGDRIPSREELESLRNFVWAAVPEELDQAVEAQINAAMKAAAEIASSIDETVEQLDQFLSEQVIDLPPNGSDGPGPFLRFRLLNVDLSQIVSGDTPFDAEVFICLPRTNKWSAESSGVPREIEVNKIVPANPEFRADVVWEEIPLGLRLIGLRAELGDRAALLRSGDRILRWGAGEFVRRRVDEEQLRSALRRLGVPSWLRIVGPPTVTTVDPECLTIEVSIAAPTDRGCSRACSPMRSSSGPR